MAAFSGNLETLVRCDKDIYTKNTKELQKMYQEYLGNIKALGAEIPPGALSQLVLEGMDEEQICEQVILLETDMLQTYSKITGEDLSAIGLAGFPTIHKQFLDDSSISVSKKDKKSLEQSSDDEGLPDDSDSDLGSDEEENDQEMDSDVDSDMNSDQNEMDSEEENDDEEISSDEEKDGESNLSSRFDEEGEEKDSDDDNDEQHSEDDEQNENDEVHDDDEEQDSDDEGYKVKKSENSDDSDDSAYDELDKQLFEKYVADSNDENGSEEESDVEDLAIASGEEDSDEETNTNNEQGSEDDEDGTGPANKKRKLEAGSKQSDSNPLGNLVVPAFSKTSVDSAFFNVRESEWIADQDIIGASNFRDIDFMEDIDDGDDEKATYADFFDAAPAPSESKKNKKSRKRKEGRKDEEENDNDEEPSNWGLEEDDDNTEESSSVGEKTINTAEQVKSRLESELEKELWLRGKLEESNISAKPWELKGEVRAADRPKDSTLTESLNFQCGQMSRPEISEKVERMLEKIALSRFRSGVFDDVERKARLVENPFEFKKKLVLNQEKSTKSLSKIYEEEHLQKERMDKAAKDNEELPEHREYRQLYEEFDEMMNALFHVHYTPKMKRAEVKIVSNLPALRAEEVTPLVVGTGAMLAPQEILAPLRGDLKGDSEKTDTDKKRERREKKHRQHLKHKETDRKIDARVKKADKDGKKLDVDTTAKVVKRAIKIGQVKMMDTTGASTKSSTSFFKQLHEQHSAASAANAKRKRNAKP